MMLITSWFKVIKIFLMGKSQSSWFEATTEGLVRPANHSSAREVKQDVDSRTSETMSTDHYNGNTVVRDR